METDLSQPKIDVQSAVGIALQHFRDSFRTENPLDVQLEEIQLSDDERHWLITVGYNLPRAGELTVTTAGGRLLLPQPAALRKYRVVRIDSNSGRPLSITIRSGV